VTTTVTDIAAEYFRISSAFKAALEFVAPEAEIERVGFTGSLRQPPLSDAAVRPTARSNSPQRVTLSGSDFMQTGTSKH
jgi:hypothetical protein